MSRFALYIHIPFCYHKCPYCDFNTYAVSSVPEREYVSALLSEMDFRAARSEWKGREVGTIYFGGGTPSIFSAASIRKIISGVGRSFPVSENAEISLEANPGVTNEEIFAEYREAGINRLSFGSQSMNIKTLKSLGRIHTPEQIESSVAFAKSAGINNINLDIIYGAPEQTTAELAEDLRQMISLSPQHISPYGLTIEKGTPFYVSYKQGRLSLPPEDSVLEMMEFLATELPRNNFIRYEISNFSLKGREARHNLAYWNCDDYLGLGAGAHSFVKTADSAERWSNYALPARYMEEAVARGRADSWRDSLSRQDLIFEYFFLGLRKTAGVSYPAFEERFQQKIDDIYGNTIGILKEQDLIKQDNDRLYLTGKGLVFSDGVIENFILTGNR